MRHTAGHGDQHVERPKFKRSHQRPEAGALHRRRASVRNLAVDGGFSNDSLVRIPFPQEASFVADTLTQVGMGGLVRDLERRLNQGAEAGARRALPIFEDAIRTMTIADAQEVLFGGEHAATDYFRARTFDSLVAEFRPEIDRSLGDVGATEIWTTISTQYNRIPLTSKKVDTDFVNYATRRALDGLFLQLAAEEANIRADPVARTTALLQRVFGYAQRQAVGSQRG